MPQTDNTDFRYRVTRHSVLLVAHALQRAQYKDITDQKTHHLLSNLHFSLLLNGCRFADFTLQVLHASSFCFSIKKLKRCLAKCQEEPAL